MKVESFVFYTSWLEAIKEIDNNKDKLDALMAIMEYQAYHVEPEAITGIPKVLFKMVKPIADSLYNRRMANVENGKKGGRPRTAQSGEEPEDKAGAMAEITQPKPNQNPTITQPKPKRNLNENDNDNENENIKNKRFIKPTLEEVQEYCQLRGNNVDPIKFYDYFNTGNWKDSKGNPVKNWKQKVITWEQYRPAKKDDDDRLQVYDTSKNRKMSDEELEALLALRRTA